MCFNKLFAFSFFYSLVNVDPVIVKSTFRKLKNTDKSIHSLHGFNTFKCIVCSQTSAEMVKHYVSNHPDQEVFISRLSPEMAELARQHRRVKLSDNFCYFCGKIKENVIDWEKHILGHTGELPYQCMDCKKSLPSIEPHDNCSSEYVSNVFEMNSPNFDLKAYLCNLCNFVQVDKKRLENHLMREHELLAETDILNEMISITLKYDCIDDGQRIDESHLNVDDDHDAADNVVVEKIMEKRTPTIKHVDASILYTCGVVDCKYIAGNDKGFIQHMRNNHSDNDSFNCCHCQKASMGVKNAMNHTVLHGDHFYKCNVCDHICPREFLINLHILRSHPNDEFKFRHTNRLIGDVSEDVALEFQCNICNEQMNVVADLSKHFREMHKSVIIDCKAIRKSSQSNEVNESLMFQQRWLCLACNRMHSLKTNLIEHRKQNHPSDPMEMQISKIVQIEAAKFPDYVKFKEQNGRFDRYLVYYCAHCHDTEYTDIYSVYGHWQQMHASADFVKPFRFEAAALARCQSCKIISTFDGLKTHYEMQHPQLKLVVNDILSGANSFSGGKCGLCNYNGNNVIGHFNDHDLILRTDVLNPIPIDDATLQRISTIQIEKQKQCFHCGNIFETISALEYHSVEDHPTKIMQYEDYIENISPFLIAGCCKTHVSMDAFIEHMRNHKIPIQCQLCSFQTMKLIDLAEHDATIHNVGQDKQFRLQCLLRTFYYQSRVVFGNGFIIAKANLIGTRFDDANKLDEFCDNGPTERRSIII